MSVVTQCSIHRRLMHTLIYDTSLVLYLVLYATNIHPIFVQALNNR